MGGSDLMSNLAVNLCLSGLLEDNPKILTRKKLSNAVPLTPESSFKYDADVNPRIIAPDPFASNDYFDVFSLEDHPFLTKFEDDNMNREDEPLSGLNGRLRPRKSAAPSPQAPKAIRKPENKPTQDRPKRTSTPSKSVTSKQNDLANKSDLSTVPQLLCPYCDRKFASKQTVSKHARRIHLSNTKPDSPIECLFCNFSEADPNDIIRHMVDSHPNQYFACLDCYTRFLSTSELAEHKLNICEKQKEKPYRSKLRQKVSTGSKKSQKTLSIDDDKVFSNDSKDFPEGPRFNGIVISCELKPSEVNDEADIEDNITTNLILPPSKALGTNAVIEKNAVIVLDDIQWNKRMPTNFSFHNTDADQILSRLGVVHRSPRAGESTKKDWFKNAEEPVQKFEKCFDTGFYSKVASNVHENLTKFLDGSFNFNPDPDSVIKTRKSKNSVVINTAEGFPILLALEQFSRNVFDGIIPRTLAPKHKWKWESDKNPVNPDDIKRDSHVNNCIITLVSSLDIWTQLCMRRKFEDKFSIPPLEKTTEKQNTISKELKQILESRELPSTSQQVVKYISKLMPSGDSLDFPASLGLKPSAPTYDMQPAVLSGEWVRPRCYVCCACGAQTRDARGLSSHISTQHPNAQVQHYEIVGELLLNADILKHLYVPPSQMCNRTRPLRGFRECTKCKKSISLEDLHQHMLDCAGDTPTVRRKCRYRPFGVRRRRPRLPDNTIRKKMRKDIRSRQNRQKTHMRARKKIRSEVGDAETIRKMLADLPAKRHRVMVNPMNPILRPRRKLDQQRNKMIMRRTSEISKNRKQREMKKDLHALALHLDDNDNKSDDDNKPLRPRIKTVFTHGPKQSESLKRKVALNIAKRRAQLIEQKTNENTGEQEPPMDMTSAGGSSSNDNNGNQLSIDNSPQRIDVNGGPYGTREQSSRGSRSNNRDSRGDQPSGGSGDSPNGNMNNNFSPMHNAPLKHSIARLTAETDAQNRSLQYHHMYLMQPPECTEIDMSQHVPSGQQRMFENEAVVTKLDKPPLHFNPSTSMDAYAYHRNKLPKPKKGLNDCIAMLKNKLVDPIPAEKMSHPVQCSNAERLECETILANQQLEAIDYQLDMNSRPAEIFSRHQLIPERYMEYPTEASIIAQNFADLPFHYVTAQRNAYDLPPPDSRVDPRYIKTAKQKVNEPYNKKEATRRRSTRSHKNSAKKQDLNVQMSPMGYPINISTPSKVNSGQGRRSSSQSVSQNLNTVAAKRRASASYNRTNSARKQHEYEAIIAQQRAFEFCQQQCISPEGLLLELPRQETFTQAQLEQHAQNKLMAGQGIASYGNKKPVLVDTKHANKIIKAAYAGSLYANSKIATSFSPENNYDSSKHASSSPGTLYDQNMHLVVSPGSRYDNNKHLSVSPGSGYDNSKQTTVSPGSMYDNNKYAIQSIQVSPGNIYDTSKHISPGSKQDAQVTMSPGTMYNNNKGLAISCGNQHFTVSPGSRYDSSKHTVISPGRQYENNKHGGYTSENRHDYTMHSSLSPKTNYDHMRQAAMDQGNGALHAAVSPGNIYDGNKRLAINPGNIYENSQHMATSPASKYNNNQNAVLSPGNQRDNSKPISVSPGSKYVNSMQGSTSPGTNYISKKQAAVATDGTYNNNKHTGGSVESHLFLNKQVLASDINYHHNQPVTSHDNAYNKISNMINPIGTGLLVTVPTTYTESAFIGKKAQAVPVENKLTNEGQSLTCPDPNYTARVNTVPRVESNLISETQALLHAESNCGNTRIVNSKKTLLAKNQNSPESNLLPKSPTAASIDNRYVNKNHAATSEKDYINKGQPTVPKTYANNQLMQCSDNNFMDKTLSEALSERDATSRQYYTENEYNIQAVPQAYATLDNNYEPSPTDIEAPLDLSKSTSKDNNALLKDDDGTYVSDNYDNYETLDLSNKGSEQDNEDVVVDLSVKMSSPNLNTCTKMTTIINDEIDSATDLSIKTRDVDDTPTDLTVKRKSISNNFEYEPARNLNYNDQEIQDLSGKKTPAEVLIMPLARMDTDRDRDIPTDLSGKPQDMPLPLTATKAPSKPKKSVDNAPDEQRMTLATDFNTEIPTVMHSQESTLSMELQLEKEKEIGKTNYEHCMQQTAVSECSYLQKVGYDSSPQKSQLEFPPATASNTLTFVEDAPRRPKSNSNLLLINDSKDATNDIAFANDAFTSVSTTLGNNGATILMTTAAGPMPLCTISNTIMPVAMSKFESTTPVYTLANACISMAKAEPSNIAPVPNALLSIPSTTIVSVAPMYTLTDTTVNPSTNYLHVHSKSAQDLDPSPSVNSTSKAQVDATSKSNPEKQNIYISSTSPSAVSISIEEPTKNTDNVATYDELDPETAKKIALLPKELVEILGTMPVDHRKQLLNVLPQYVSNSAPTSHNDGTDASTALLVNRGVSPARIPDFDIKPSLGYSPVSSSQMNRPLTATMSGVEKLEETKTLTLYQPAVASKPAEEVRKYEAPEQIPKVYEIDGNTVIDLTDDDVPLHTEVVNVTEESNNTSKMPNEPVTVVPPMAKCYKQKLNDQTASLRAVRIKAPSERNKSVSIDNSLVKKSSNEQVKSNIEVVEDKDDCSDLDKTLAIQQAEISSTQHNTAIVGNCKYPLAISPSSTEYSGDESSKPLSQQSPIPKIEAVTEKLVAEIHDKPVPKTSMVSSSISTNELSRKDTHNNHEVLKLPKTPNESNMSLLLTANKELDISKKRINSDRILKESRIDTSIPILDHEEDSDDDISLAALVKQKQRDQMKIEDDAKSITQVDKPIETERKRKEKKGKKAGKKMKTETQDTNSTSTSDTLNDVGSNLTSHSQQENKRNTHSNASDDQDGKDIFCYVVGENIDHGQVSKYSKKKAKKGRRHADVLDIVKNHHIKEQSNVNEKDINKEDNLTSKVINDKMSSDENTSGLVTVSQSCNKNILHEDTVTKDFEDGTEINNHKIIEEMTEDPLKKMSKCDDKLVVCSANAGKELNKVKEKRKRLEFSKLDQESGDMPSVNKEQNPLTATELDTNEDTLLTHVAQPGGKDSRYEVLAPGHENDFAETKKGKKSVRAKKSKSEDIIKMDHEVDSSENLSDTVETRDKITPLRRSRRGKSLFLDNTSIDQDALDEITVEQKVPLTKKLYSKILHDEENPEPSAHSTPEKQDVINSGACEPITNTEAGLEISDIENVNEVYPEKSKGTKRRISAHFSKKTKKKKSIDETNIVNDISDTCEKSIITVGIDSIRVKETPTVLTSDIQNASEIIRQQSEHISDSIINNKQVLSTEKRKNNNQISFDLSQSSKPKKCKFIKGDRNVNDSTDDKTEGCKLENPVPSIASETKTACYNLPVPARRARSKSVVVKSTYDPYDIDLEDMIEQNEIIKKKDKNTENATQNKPNKSANKSVKEVRKDLRTKESVSKEIVIDNKDKEYDKGNVSDSDDSSKSDVPLQKYVKEKEKKSQEEEEANTKKYNKDSKAQADKQHIENKNTRCSPAVDILPNMTQTQADEELRSEQFMESFGFFSERKPRKSNLLATKKISETFHITNESDDTYFGFKERTGKRNLNTDSKKSIDTDTSKIQPQPSTSKRAITKRGRKIKKTHILPCYCGICKKEFRRSDNYLRHQINLLHVAKLLHGELKVKPPVHDEPNYLIAYKQYLDRLKRLTDLLAEKQKKYPKAAAKIVLPTLEEVLADVHKTVRNQQRCARGLSRDEALFLDCCELLKESHLLGARGMKRFGMSGLDVLERALDDLEANENYIDSDDDDCDSITAQNILDSEEVRNLENDLITGLQEAANATRNANVEYQHSLNEFAAPQVVQMVQIEQERQMVEAVEQLPQENQIVTEPQETIVQESQPEQISEKLSTPNTADDNQTDECDIPAKPRPVRAKKHYEVKEKMYPDIQIEDIDMFEDKFDKIKRKCRSQAAAAKQTQPVAVPIDQTVSHKGRKKSEKKKGKRSSKKAKHQSTHVPTKGALKGFDGIKVSIPTSDIDMSAIVPVSESSPKKKKKSSSKKKRDKRDSESSSKYDSDHRAKDNSAKKVDVYEFMDNEDAELFEFRPSTLMERFKSMSNNNKDTPSSSKFHPVTEENSSQGSASDGDDFVYMSDDYVGSDDETENSLLSCGMGNVKIGNDIKKNSPQKRKDAVEKNAVMGKIFKHNAVRAEKKVVVPKQTEKPKANFDQLFDSLLEDEPNSSMLNSDAPSPKNDEFTPSKKYSSKSNSRSASPTKNDAKQSPTLSKLRSSSPTQDYVSSNKGQDSLPSKKYESIEVDYGPTSKKYDSSLESVHYGPNLSKKYYPMPKDYKKSSPKSYDSSPIENEDDKSFKNYETKNKKRNDSTSSKHDDELFNLYQDDLKSPTNKQDEGISTSYDYNTEVYDQSALQDETGVARHRARRKCTVGKQNVLAETWSSESEPDGGPPRPNSAESDISAVGRKKKGRKKEGQQAGGRRGNNRQVAFKKQDVVESRVSSSRFSGSAFSGAVGSGVDFHDPGEGTSGMSSTISGSMGSGAGSTLASDSAAAAAAAAAAMPAPSTSAVAGPSNVKGRPRSVAYYWSSEGDDEQEHLQQHGWIVGDSHKKLVTMLAHAKGRKRNNDDKRHLVE